MRRTTLQYTYIIGPVSEMCIIPTFLVTRPIHISKAGLWQSAFVRGDAAIRLSGILKEQQLSGAVMHCWFVGLMLGSAWDMLILSVWERLECLGTVVNKICVRLCVRLDVSKSSEFIPITSTHSEKFVTFLPFQLEESWMNLSVRATGWEQSTCAAACLEDHYVNPTGLGWFLYESVCLT